MHAACADVHGAGSTAYGVLEGSVKEALDRLVADLHGRKEDTFQMMRRLDTNGSGRLDRAELREGLRDLGVRLNDSKMDALLQEFDTNRDGRVDMMEFSSVIERHQNV